MCFDFLYNFLLNISHFKKIWSKLYVSLRVKYMLLLLLSDFNETWSFRQIFWTYLTIKFHKTRPVEPSCSVPMGEGAQGRTEEHTGRNDKASSSFPQFCERVQYCSG